MNAYHSTLLADEVSMEPGKIHLVNTGGQDGGDISQTICVAGSNRLYRIRNDGSGNGGSGLMRIRATRTLLWFNINSVFDLETGRSIDVYGYTITVTALDTLQLFGSFDTI